MFAHGLAVWRTAEALDGYVATIDDLEGGVDSRDWDDRDRVARGVLAQYVFEGRTGSSTPARTAEPSPMSVQSATPHLRPLQPLLEQRRGWLLQVTTTTKVTIGRSDECDLVVADLHVSRKHAELIRTDDGTYEIRDLDSNNGTFVNGDAVEHTPLTAGDVVSVGNTLYRFTGTELEHLAERTARGCSPNTSASRSRAGASCSTTSASPSRPRPSSRCSARQGAASRRC